MSNELINFEYKGVPDPDFKLRYISISKYEGDWNSLPHTHQFSELFYVLHGEGIFYIEDEKVSMKTDDLMIINPYVEHTEKTLPNNPMEYIVFVFGHLVDEFLYFLLGEEMPADVEHQSPPCKLGFISDFYAVNTPGGVCLYRFRLYFRRE